MSYKRSVETNEENWNYTTWSDYRDKKHFGPNRKCISHHFIFTKIVQQKNSILAFHRKIQSLLLWMKENMASLIRDAAAADETLEIKPQTVASKYIIIITWEVSISTKIFQVPLQKGQNALYFMLSCWYEARFINQCSNVFN